MSDQKRNPQFGDFSRWLAGKMASGAAESPDARLVQAAADARDSYLATQAQGVESSASTECRYHEPLKLLAASSPTGNDRPTELTTSRGLMLSFVYDDASATPDITVLVKCLLPAHVPLMVGRMVWILAGTQRFQSSPFNPDGEAIVVIPAGLELSTPMELEAPDLESE